MKKQIRFLIAGSGSVFLILLLLKFIEFCFVDACIDRGGRFLRQELLCEGEGGYISFFNWSPYFLFTLSLIFGFLIATFVWKIKPKME